MKTKRVRMHNVNKKHQWSIEHSCVCSDYILLAKLQEIATRVNPMWMSIFEEHNTSCRDAIVGLGDAQAMT